MEDSTDCLRICRQVGNRSVRLMNLPTKAEIALLQALILNGVSALNVPTKYSFTTLAL